MAVPCIAFSTGKYGRRLPSALDRRDGRACPDVGFRGRADIRLTRRDVASSGNARCNSRTLDCETPSGREVKSSVTASCDEAHTINCRCARPASLACWRVDRRDRPYQAGRSKHWIKVKNRTHPAMNRVMESFG